MQLVPFYGMSDNNSFSFVITVTTPPKENSNTPVLDGGTLDNENSCLSNLMLQISEYCPCRWMQVPGGKY